jgi:hypothetical protein
VNIKEFRAKLAFRLLKVTKETSTAWGPIEVQSGFLKSIEPCRRLKSLCADLKKKCAVLYNVDELIPLETNRDGEKWLMLISKSV